jgi:adenosylhomocysteinase
MQMSFANQFMATVYLKKNHVKMEHRVYDVPREIEEDIAYATLDSLGISIDKPTKEQLAYAESWIL